MGLLYLFLLASHRSFGLSKDFDNQNMSLKVKSNLQKVKLSKYEATTKEQGWYNVSTPKPSPNSKIPVLDLLILREEPPVSIPYKDWHAQELTFMWVKS